MHVLRVRNVAEALPRSLEYLLTEGRREDSRAGPVVVAPGPVTTVYERPCERVLFSVVRDANPFFHIYESIWMLAGRDDTEPLNRFVGRFGASYGEPGGEVHGAYGRRWRSAFGFDQLDFVIKKLREDPSSRQCVIQMWDASAKHEVVQDAFGVGISQDGKNPVAGEDDLRGVWKDRCCNTHCYLRVRGDRGMRDLGNGNVEDYDDRVLDLTICCRSNDAIWGAHGANAVHFSVLQEYLAARIGVGVGVMTQVSNNYHAYVSEIDRLRAKLVIADDDAELIARLEDQRYFGVAPPLRPTPLFDRPDAADADVDAIMDWCDGKRSSTTFVNSWFQKTLVPAMCAHVIFSAGKLHRAGGAVTENAIWIASQIESPDWRSACVEWLERRAR